MKTFSQQQREEISRTRDAEGAIVPTNDTGYRFRPGQQRWRKVAAEHHYDPDTQMSAVINDGILATAFRDTAVDFALDTVPTPVAGHEPPPEKMIEVEDSITGKVTTIPISELYPESVELSEEVLAESDV